MRPREADDAACWDAAEARLTASISERMLELARVGVGHSVLDLASGRGEPALRVARRVGPGGKVVAVELDEGRATALREAATREQLPLEVQLRSAQDLDTTALFDAVTCRWGLMYLPEPIEVLRRVRQVLKATGVLVVALWGEPERVEWWRVPRAITESFTSLPPVVAGAPSPFRFANAEQLSREFGAAGFDVVAVEEHWIPVVQVSSAVELADWGRVVMSRWYDAVPPAHRAAWVSRWSIDALPFKRDGLFTLGGVTRLAVARPRA